MPSPVSRLLLAALLTTGAVAASAATGMPLVTMLDGDATLLKVVESGFERLKLAADSKAGLLIPGPSWRSR